MTREISEEKKGRRENMEKQEVKRIICPGGRGVEKWLQRKLGDDDRKWQAYRQGAVCEL